MQALPLTSSQRDWNNWLEPSYCATLPYTSKYFSIQLKGRYISPPSLRPLMVDSSLIRQSISSYLIPAASPTTGGGSGGCGGCCWLLMLASPTLALGATKAARGRKRRAAASLEQRFHSNTVMSVKRAQMTMRVL
ncbi:hypothetical protein EYF80_024878 [Liparis tanakae]|uniref:Uncharacterized protein n=1 Tax=Liparis tanakae TaxID=230148 RepID=A0A4Z2HH71_9TELE|nr:hypothetical protein EYF80_024878 [Liparis tanakae]